MLRASFQVPHSPHVHFPAYCFWKKKGLAFGEPWICYLEHRIASREFWNGLLEGGIACSEICEVPVKWLKKKLRRSTVHSISCGNLRKKRKSKYTLNVCKVQILYFCEDAITRPDLSCSPIIERNRFGRPCHTRLIDTHFHWIFFFFFFSTKKKKNRREKKGSSSRQADCEAWARPIARQLPQVDRQFSTLIGRSRHPTFSENSSICWWLYMRHQLSLGSHDNQYGSPSFLNLSHHHTVDQLESRSQIAAHLERARQEYPVQSLVAGKRCET